LGIGYHDYREISIMGNGEEGFMIEKVLNRVGNGTDEGDFA